MKPVSISADRLFEEHREALHWQWIVHTARRMLVQPVARLFTARRATNLKDIQA